VPVVWAKSESFMPGGASNVANNIHAVNASVHICGVVGDDEEGRILISELTKNGVNTDGIIIDETRPTVNKTRIIAHHQQVVRIDKEDDGPIGPKVLNKILDFIKRRISEVDAVIIEDYGKGLIVPSLIKNVIDIARRNKKIITVDPKEEHIRLYKNVTAIKPNRREAELVTGIKIKGKDSLKKAGNRLLDRLKTDAVLITLGEDGMVLFQSDGRMIHIPTVAQEVYDVSGAGDTAIALFTIAKASGANNIEAAHIANIAAGIVVEKLGIAVCSTQELRAHLGQLKEDFLNSKKEKYPSETIF
ncbi:MAG: PfkB family carbohydrate kinase, partial [Candidatus Omnitrophota bacterium]